MRAAALILALYYVHGHRVRRWLLAHPSVTAGRWRACGGRVHAIWWFPGIPGEFAIILSDSR